MKKHIHRRKSAYSRLLASEFVNHDTVDKQKILHDSKLDFGPNGISIVSPDKYIVQNFGVNSIKDLSIEIDGPVDFSGISIYKIDGNVAIVIKTDRNTFLVKGKINE